MTFGQKLKKARTDANMTQKELADALGVTFQTASKWENGTTEPDIATLNALSKTLSCSIEYLVGDVEEKETEPPEPEETIVTPLPPDSPALKVISTCRDCGNPIHEGELYHNVERRSPSGVKETVTVCDACFVRHEEEIERRAKEVEASMSKPQEKKGGIFHKITDRNDRKPLIWSIVIGVLALVIALVVCIINFQTVGIGWTIGAPLLAGYTVCATIYCIFTASYVSSIFMTVASWSVRFPGIIFTWDLDGFMWLIAMKFLFFRLGILISVATFLLAVFLSAIFSIFTFIPLLIYNKTHY